MKKNIAVLLFGEYREFENTLISLEPFIEEGFDFYVSTWNISQQYKEQLDIEIYENITEQKIRKYLPNAKIKISDVYELGDTQTKMNFHWLALAEMVKNSEKNYDIIVMKRIDSYVWDINSTLYEHNSEDTMYVRNGLNYVVHTVDEAGNTLDEILTDEEVEVSNTEYPMIDDTTFVASYNSFMKFIDKIPPLPKTFVSHIGLVDIIIDKAGLEVKKIRGFSNCILRPNMRPFITKNHEKNKSFLITNFERYNDEWSEST